ncbi:TPA: hypothetical protein NNT57_004560 [Salmonella enterica]|uniref:Uncharacterized protein n=1 Tax=Acinetobacter phage Ab_SZ3 TaxID=2781361 RepID=A0A873WI50_9CAUD|nr:hypothetical protein AbSZ3_49 [Acinetobacter phage Ab_SZ3]HCH8780794.1 hypothetical protein [Salmonella enterica]HCH9143021.1 hypothetical protein [Salmonella enterica]
MNSKFSNLTNDQMIQLWHKTQEQLRSLKEHEAEQRQEVLDRMFANKAGSEGTTNIELGHGWKLKATFKKTIGFTSVDELNAALDRMEDHSPEGKLLADRLVSWKPSLSLTEFKQLPSDFVGMMKDVITIKDATPSVELVAPKAK